MVPKMLTRHVRGILSQGLLRHIVSRPSTMSSSRSSNLTMAMRALIQNDNIYCADKLNLQYRTYSIQDTPENITVGYEEVKNAISNKNTYIIDVREPDEIKEHGKIPGSINIPLNDVANTLSLMTEKEFEYKYNMSKPSEDSPIIFYCMIGKRSGMAQQNALNLGFKQVKNYVGSWRDWSLKTK